MRKEWRYFLLALGFFTRIPVPSLVDFDESELNHSAKYFPLVGLIVGAIGALVYALASQTFPQSIAVLLSMAATILLTGAFHEDGLADSIDGLGGAFDRERALTIMQDSRLGTYGAAALFFALTLKFQALSSLVGEYSVAIVLLVAHPLSRLCAVCLMVALPYAKPSGKSKPLATKISRTDFCMASFFGTAPLLILLWVMYVFSDGDWLLALAFALLVLGLMAAVWLWWCRLLQRKIGGYTGDTLGATQQLTELAFYLGTLVWSAQF